MCVKSESQFYLFSARKNFSSISTRQTNRVAQLLVKLGLCCVGERLVVSWPSDGPHTLDVSQAGPRGQRLPRAAVQQDLPQIAP